MRCGPILTEFAAQQADIAHSEQGWKIYRDIFENIENIRFFQYFQFFRNFFNFFKMYIYGICTYTDKII